MERTAGYVDFVQTDDTGSIISLDWTCPHCDFENHQNAFSSMPVETDDFEIDLTCDWCHEDVTIECYYTG